MFVFSFLIKWFILHEIFFIINLDVVLFSKVFSIFDYVFFIDYIDDLNQ